MRHLILILLLLMSCSEVNGQDKKTKHNTNKKTEITLEQIDNYRAQYRTFLDAIAKVESNNNDEAIGDKGKAIGRYQIWEIYWKDALTYAPKIEGTYQDCRTKDYAERVLIAYMMRYARKALQDNDLETLARVHNGGPKGATKQATESYWEKVSKIIFPK